MQQKTPHTDWLNCHKQGEMADWVDQWCDVELHQNSTAVSFNQLVGWLVALLVGWEIKVPFEHKTGYIGDKVLGG